MKRKRNRLLYLLGVVAFALVVWRIVHPAAQRHVFWHLIHFRSLRYEAELKSRIRNATSVTIFYLPHGSPWDPRGEELRSEPFFDPEKVASLVAGLSKDLRRYDAGDDKCFEGIEHCREYWSRAVFTDTQGQKATIYLPMGDCGVWPEGLPWGWDYGSGIFIDRVFKMIGRR